MQMQCKNTNFFRELIDKITILKIKSNKINSNEAQKNIRLELEKLEHILNKKSQLILI